MGNGTRYECLGLLRRNRKIPTAGYYGARVFNSHFRSSLLVIRSLPLDEMYDVAKGVRLGRPYGGGEPTDVLGAVRGSIMDQVRERGLSRNEHRNGP